MNNIVQTSVVVSLRNIFNLFGNPIKTQQGKLQLKPGDIIFSRTNSLLYQVSRKIMDVKYDHISVVMNKKEVKFISPIITGELNIDYIIHPSRNPLIIRPDIENIQQFVQLVSQIPQQTISVTAIASIIYKETMRALKIRKNSKNIQIQQLKPSLIGSDVILYALCKSSDKIKQIVRKNKTKADKKYKTFFIPDQIIQILEAIKSKVILKSSLQQQYELVQTISQIEKGIGNFGKRIMDKIVTPTEQTQLVIENGNKKKKPTRMQSLLVFQFFSLIINISKYFNPLSQSDYLATLNAIMMIGYLQDFKLAKEIAPKL